MNETRRPLKITVVTPNFNGEAFLEDTIQSVVSQNYPNLEYIFVDGGSSDGSMQIAERYSKYFAHIICESDSGHADALNKGFRLATGDVLAWINSDDLLLPGSLNIVNQAFSTFPEVDWLTGRPSTVRESGQFDPLRPLRTWSWIRFLCGDYRYIQQESTFWRRSLWQAAGGALDLRYGLANDFELWLRFFRRTSLHTIDAPLGCFRFRGGQRSVAHATDYERECEQALDAFVDVIPAALLARYFHLMPSEHVLSRRVRPATLPSGLSELDPPLITIDSDTGNLNMGLFKKRDVPVEFKPEVTAREDLIFDGLDRVVWSDGPCFTNHDLVAAEIEIAPFSPGVAVGGGLSETSPPMVALIGPLAISDWGGGKITLQIKFRDGAVSQDLQLTEADRIYRVKLLLSTDRYTLILDGQAIAVDSTKGQQVMQSPYVVLGGGHAQRFWVGTVSRAAITVVDRTHGGLGGIGHRAYLLVHESGARSLPRQRRYGVPPVRFVAIEPDRQSTPLTSFRNRHRGQRCFVMGNGPSLNKMELEKLAGEVVFACNSAFLLFDRVTWRPTYYTCVDTRVVRDRAADISQMLDADPSITAFFPTVIHLHDGSGAEFLGREVIPPGTNHYYFNEIGNRESHHVETMFSLDADDYVVQPYTVAITMLQLAAFMGFSEIYLIGCDTSYTVQESVKQEGQAIEGVGLLLTSTRDDDCNHFDPRYFGQGREWHNPQVSKMINHYRWAQRALRQSGTRIFNATVGGQLEVFQRVNFNSLFQNPSGSQSTVEQGPRRKLPLLSIAIPAYDRPDTLIYALERFVAQIAGKYDEEIEIVVSDDCSPGDSLRPVRELAARHAFLNYRRYEKNIGLEKNLLSCAETCVGEYLWLFGDDDFLDTDDALDRVIAELREGRFDAIILNRSRRSTDLETLISPNWMNLDADLRKQYSGLRQFCLDFGLISVLGFISVNVFRRRLFQRIEAERYMGTMYPQLGALLEAFHNRPTLLLGAPLVCHRTQTAEEKRRALGGKASEASFMADVRRRNAIYFSHPYIAMLDRLLAVGAFGGDDLVQIRENTVINGLLIDFLIDCVHLNDELGLELSATSHPDQWSRTAKFFNALPMEAAQRKRVLPILSRHVMENPEAATLTISVITPSFNQAEFLADCLRSVRDQTHPALEHLVFDPGSKDDSRAIASQFSHVTLFAEPDKGQSDALNKGFTRARGDLICWLNSDDQLADKEIFSRIIERFSQPDAPDVVYGKGVYIDEHGKKLRDAYINTDPTSLPWRFQQEDGIMQPALFMRRSVIERVGLLRDDLHFSMDYEYWIRCVKAGVKFVFVDSVFAVARYHLNNKTYGQRGESYAEVCSMMREHFGYVHHAWLRRYAEFLAEGHDGVLAHGANAGIKDADRLERMYVELLTRFNADTKTVNLLRGRRLERGYGGTYDEMVLRKLIDNKSGRTSLPVASMLVGPFDRTSLAHCDETDCVAKLFSGTLTGRSMIDVGAHHGWAFSPFLDMGWNVFAFEPDENNRAELLGRLARHRNKVLVSLDERCVSNKSEKGASFYSSVQSTGISGLSAFHESHIETQRVDTITLTEFFQNRPMPKVDFLKIDTEGHDLFVMQGFPWDRGKPAVIECEFEDAKTFPLGYTFHDLARFLVGKGYVVYVSEWHPIIRYGIRHDWNRLLRYPCELADSKGWGNLLAFRDPIDEKDLVAAMRKVLKVGAADPEKPHVAVAANAYVSQEVTAALEYKVEPSPYFSALSSNQWRYTHSDVPQKLWRAVFDLPGQTKGRVFSAGIRLQSDRAITVNVTLGRHGKTEWEAATKGIVLKPGVTQSVKLSKEFTKTHDALKLQVEVMALEGGGVAVLTIDSLHVNESLASIRRRVGETSLTLREANRLFRERDFSTAMGIYLLLHRQYPLQIYPDNALMAARKLGMMSVATVEDLLQRVEG